jgi:hypothetical protein
MKTFLSDIFPKIQKYSEKLDNLSLLNDQHWVSIDEILSNKIVYIFRAKNELLVSTNGKVEKAKWEYLGNNSLLIDKTGGSYLFKHGFFDENILALKVDSSEEYAVFVNENKYIGELNSIERIVDFLQRTYLDPIIKSTIENTTGYINIPTEDKSNKIFVKYYTHIGVIEIEPCLHLKGQKAFFNGNPAPDGKYKYGFLQSFTVENGIIIKG